MSQAAADVQNDDTIFSGGELDRGKLTGLVKSTIPRRERRSRSVPICTATR